MDRVTDHIFHFKGDGLIKDFPGTYTALIEKNKKEALTQKAAKSSKEESKSKPKQDNQAEKLGYMERREFNKLEKEIEKLEQKKEELTVSLSDSKLEAEELLSRSEELGQLVEQIDEKTARWMELADRA
jgi:ATP-binding cassette subfamily F protein uup